MDDPEILAAVVEEHRACEQEQQKIYERKWEQDMDVLREVEDGTIIKQLEEAYWAYREEVCDRITRRKMQRI